MAKFNEVEENVSHANLNQNLATPPGSFVLANRDEINEEKLSVNRKHSGRMHGYN